MAHSIILMVSYFRNHITYNQIAILVMISIMSLLPISTTDIAKLKSTSASHVIATLILLYYKFALLALPIVQVFFEELDLLRVTFTLVLIQQTFWAKFATTVTAKHEILKSSSSSYHPFTVLSWTQFDIRIIYGNIELV